MICCLQGGMGNQMFQYAMAKAASLRLGCALQLNVSRFTNCNLGRMYSLGLWKGVTETITTGEHNPLREDGLPYNPYIVARITSGSTLIGYWQTDKYFSDMAVNLRSIFVPRQAMTPHGVLIRNKIQEVGNRSTFLTVRRSDYLTSNFHGMLGQDYYLNALEEIKKKVDPFVFVFSDDPHWCQAELNLPCEMMVAGNFDQTSRPHLGREDEELTLMRMCKNAIMANSSYSWWGAWLNPDPGIVVAPKKWFLSTEEDPKDIVPERWLRV